MNWLEMLNFAACLFLLYCLLAAGHLAHHLRHRIALTPISLMLGVQAVDPVIGWLPNDAWPSVALKLAIIFAIVMMRKEVWSAAQVRLA